MIYCKETTLVSAEKTGIEQKRKVLMLDAKNWFDEKVNGIQTQRSTHLSTYGMLFPIKWLNA